MRLEVSDRGFCRRSLEKKAAKRLRRAAEHARHAVETARRVHAACTWGVLAIEDEPADTNVPYRMRGQRVCEMGKRHGRHRCVPAQRRFERFHERREFWIDPE